MALNDGDTTPHGDYELRYGYVETGLKGGRHVIEAHHPEDGRVGRMEWMGRPPYAIHSLEVSDDHQRQGLATGMWNWSQDRGRPKPTHSAQRTDKGDAWARSVGGKLPRRIASGAGDFSSYFGGQDGRVLHTAGRGKPRRDGGSGAAPQGGGGSAPQGGESGQGDPVGAGQGGTRSVEFHPQAVKDLAALDKPVQRQIHGVIEGLAAGTVQLAQTHTLTKALSGWSTTKASRGHRIVHRNTDDGGLHIGYIGLHDYGKAERRLGSLSRESGPVTFPYLRNTEGAPNLGRTYGQDIEPHGRYLSYHAGDKPEGDRWETGEVSFQNPLHLDFGGNYGDPSNWKNQLSQQHGGKCGKALSRAVVKSGHDGIITHDEYGPSEIVDLTGLKAKTAEHQDDKPLPNELYHVTTARDDVLEHGLKTRDELGQRHGHGFGSGRDDTISLTAHEPTAQHLLHSLHEYHDVLNGKIPLTELKEKARKGMGAKRPYDFMFDDHDQSDERLAQVDSGRVTEPRFHVLGEQPEGWEPKDKGMTGQNGARSHFFWEHPLSEDEKIKERSAAYKNFAWGRQASGGHMDPLFMGNDPKSFAAKDPSQFALLHVRPEDGAHGIQMNDRTEGTDAGEWRAHSGNDLRVVHHESREDIPPRVAAKTLNDLDHHQRAVADAQNAVRLVYPAMHTMIRPGEDADAALRHMLKQHGHPKHEDAFVGVHDGSRGFSSTAKDRETGAVGVVLHPERADYGTLAHEAAHLLHDHQTGRGFRQPAPDESIHGIGFIQHYAALLEPFGKTRTPGGNRKSGGPSDLLLNTYYDSLNQRRKTSSHAAPTSRVFGPTFGLDHRLFEGETLKPEVRAAVMGRLGPVLEPLLGQSWEMYTRVYLAGSEASEWTSATLEGNGDFDTLIGIDYDHARDMHLPLGDLDDSDITDMVNTALRTAYNASPWVAPFGGTWDLTGYVNANSYDITRIKPYAAYNITDDTWAVRPPHLPDWGIDKLPEGGQNLLAEAEGYAAVVDAISKMPEPFQTQQGKALWHHLHTDRGRAFSDQGEGWLDPGNLIEKALVEWGVWDKLVEWQYGKQHTAGWKNWEPTTIHRGMGINLPDDVHDYVHDSSIPRQDRAARLTEYVGRQPHGMHWTDDPDVARDFASRSARKEHLDEADIRSTPIVVHADPPDLSHIETDKDVLYKRRVRAYDDEKDAESEIPMKAGSPVKINAITWADPASYRQGRHRFQRSYLNEPVQHTAAADPPTIKRGVILDGHPVTGHIKDGDWNAGGWDPDVAHRLVKGTATHHDVLKHLNTNQVGHFWYHPDHADIEDAQDFANPNEPIKNWMDDPQEDGRISGEVGVVMEAHHPKGWNPEEQNPSHPLMGNSYLPDNSHLRLHKLHYTADGGENWHTIPVEHHGITVHTDGPGDQKTAATAYDPDDDDHYRSYTDWDKAYPRLPEDIHRGVAVQLDPDTHEAIHGEGHSDAERAHAAIQAATLKPLGMHWSSAGSEMAGRIAEDEAEQLTPRERRNTTHVVLHADRPERQHIETDMDRLVQHSVISHGRSPENEVPLKEHAPVHIWGVSWKHHDEPDWHTHELDEPVRKTAVKSSDHELAPDLPQEQHDALTAEPMNEYYRQSLNVAKNPVAGTHMWRGEIRSGDPIKGARESGVGMHWSVNPDAIVHAYPHDDQRSVVYHAELEHPGEQNYTRDHPMWQGKHFSGDREAEIRLKPGSKVKLHGAWVKDPEHPDPGYFVPRSPERMGAGWSYHPIGEHVTVAHKPMYSGTIDYSDVGIGKEAMGARGDLPEGLTFEHRPPTRRYPDDHQLRAHAPDGTEAGHITWFEDDGEIAGVETHPDYQRRGLATELHRRAREISPHLMHSDDRTDSGEQWVKSLNKEGMGANGPVPKGLTFRHENNGYSHSLTAEEPENGEIGYMQWSKSEQPAGAQDEICPTCERYQWDEGHKHPAGEIEDIDVSPMWRRRGVGKAMLEHARSLPVHPKPVHSDVLTDEGRAWKEKTSMLSYFIKTAEDDDTDYRMQHRPPDADYGAPLHDLESFMPDVYTHPHYYGDQSDPSVREAHRQIQRAKGKPEARVKVFRAVPADYADQGFRPGDWVTTSKDYARLHGRHHEDSKHDWPVISTTVRANELHSSGDDPREYGYNGEHKPMGMVSFKGGYHEEVRHDTEGKIVRVKRRIPKTSSMSDYFGVAA